MSSGLLGLAGVGLGLGLQRKWVLLVYLLNLVEKMNLAVLYIEYILGR